eukprot:364837-Chlamydomonas_euryale.AAC.5
MKPAVQGVHSKNLELSSWPTTIAVKAVVYYDLDHHPFQARHASPCMQQSPRHCHVGSCLRHLPEAAADDGVFRVAVPDGGIRQRPGAHI